MQRPDGRENLPDKSIAACRPSEPLFSVFVGEIEGYVRAARIWNNIYISGMTAVACLGNVVGPGSSFNVLGSPLATVAQR